MVCMIIKLVDTPFALHLKLNKGMSPKDEEGREYIAKVPYTNVVGSLMYVVVCTRPDLSQVVGVVSKYIHDAGREHWQAVEKILRYIQNAVDVGLVFEQDVDIGQHIVRYCDSDYTRDLDKH